MKKKSTHGGSREGSGKPRRFLEYSVGRTLHLPESFWALLAEAEGSRTSSFIEALQSEAGVAKMRAILSRE